MKWPQTEVELAKPLIAWLIDQKWEVYQEVQIASYGAVADIVAVMKPIVWVIECKKSLSLDVMGQAHRWSWKANHTSIAIPNRERESNGAIFAKTVLRNLGIGLLEVSDPERYGDPVNERISPRLDRKSKTHWITDCLTDDHKTWAEAGNPDGKRYTPFQKTKRDIINRVRHNPGIGLKELLESMDHHYASNASARGSISCYIQTGVIEGIEIRRDGNRIHLYLEEKQK